MKSLNFVLFLVLSVLLYVTGYVFVLLNSKVQPCKVYMESTCQPYLETEQQAIVKAKNYYNCLLGVAKSCEVCEL